MLVQKNQTLGLSYVVDQLSPGRPFICTCDLDTFSATKTLAPIGLSSYLIDIYAVFDKRKSLVKKNQVLSGEAAPRRSSERLGLKHNHLTCRTNALIQIYCVATCVELEKSSRSHGDMDKSTRQVSNHIKTERVL